MIKTFRYRILNLKDMCGKFYIFVLAWQHHFTWVSTKHRIIWWYSVKSMSSSVACNNYHLKLTALILFEFRIISKHIYKNMFWSSMQNISLKMMWNCPWFWNTTWITEIFEKITLKISAIIKHILLEIPNRNIVFC